MKTIGGYLDSMLHGSKRDTDGELIGGGVRLRVQAANDFLPDYSRTRNITGYYTDDDGDGETMKPVVALLPGGRGYLPGWTLGQGMATVFDVSLYDDAKDAAFAAHGTAEYAAEQERAYQAEERARMDAEDAAEQERIDAADAAARESDAEFLRGLADNLDDDDSEPGWGQRLRRIADDLTEER